MYCTSLWYSWTNTNIFSTVQFRTIQERGGLQKSLPGVQLPYSNSMQSTGAHRQKRARVPLKNIFTLNEATHYSGEFWRIRENSNKKQDYLYF